MRLGSDRTREHNLHYKVLPKTSLSHTTILRLSKIKSISIIRTTENTNVISLILIFIYININGKLSFHISHNRLSIAQYLVAMEMMGYLNDQVSFGEYSFAYAKKMRPVCTILDSHYINFTIYIDFITTDTRF